MTEKEQKVWWNQLPPQVGGDVIVGNVNEGASNVAVGKNITQTIYNALGEPTPEDKQIIAQQVAQVLTALRQKQAQRDPATTKMAEFQTQLLQSELTKTEEGETPSASTITRVGDWLLDNVPEIAEALTSLFATPAVGKVVGKAGEAAVSWVKKRFSNAH